MLGFDDKTRENVENIADFGEICKNYEGELSLFDAKIITKRLQGKRLWKNLDDLTHSSLDDAFFIDDLKKSIQEKTFVSKDCGQYMEKITHLAANLTSPSGKKDDKGLIKGVVKDELQELPREEITDSTVSHRRIYLDMRYNESRQVPVYEQQSIKDYKEHGLRMHYKTENVTKDLNPNYVKQHLPSNLQLCVDNKGYFLTQKATPITNAELQNLESQYSQQQQQ